jgi:hexosaminidase
LQYVPWKFSPRGSPVGPDIGHVNVRNEILRVVVSLNSNTSGWSDRPGDVNNDESYTLSIPNEGNARLTANTTLGILHGLTTLGQVFNRNVVRHNFVIHNVPKQQLRCSYS